MPSNVKTILVIGAGLMGSGIAQTLASSGCKVFLVDKNQQLLKNSMSLINGSLNKLASKKFTDEIQAKQFVGETLQNINNSTGMSEAASSSDLIIEAIIEDLPIKQKLFKELDKDAPRDTIFTSNTSSLPIVDIAQYTARKSKFAGLHFFNPVPIMKLVEVISTNETSPQTITTLREFVKGLGKQPVSCKDTPGFIVNRLLIPYLVQALQMYERGDATKEDIDIAMKLGAGYPMGPFELLDFIGLDTTSFILEGWHKKFPENPLFAKTKILEDLIKSKKFGRKSKQGFYTYK